MAALECGVERSSKRALLSIVDTIDFLKQQRTQFSCQEMIQSSRGKMLIFNIYNTHMPKRTEHAKREQRYNGNVEIMAKVEIEDNYNFAAFPGFWRRRDSISHAVGSPLVIVGQT